MHHLERPLALARGNVEADDGFRRLVLAAAPSAVVVVPGRAGAEEDETALGVHRHRPPDIGVAGEPPRFLPPTSRRRSRSATAGWRSTPTAVSRCARRIPGRCPGARRDLVPIGNCAADDDDVPVDDRRRPAVVDVPDVGNGPRVAVGERHDAVVAERDDGLAGRASRLKSWLRVLSSTRSLLPSCASRQSAGARCLNPVPGMPPSFTAPLSKRHNSLPVSASSATALL